MTNTANLNLPVTAIKGVGPSKQKLLSKLGILTIKDLLYFFPRRYIDRGNTVFINKLENGTVQTVAAKIVGPPTVRRINCSLNILKIPIRDKTGLAYAVWFNQPYIKQKLIKGQEYFFSGKVNKTASGELQIMTPDFCPSNKSGFNRIKPVYRLTDGLGQNFIAKVVEIAVKTFIDQVEEVFPSDFLHEKDLLGIKDSILNIHFPRTFTDIQKARRRIAYEEIFLLQLKIKLLKREREQCSNPIKFKVLPEIYQFLAKLPFELTDAQNRALKQVFNDMKNSIQMNRLIQGDVGSGKTVIAVCALFLCTLNGFQGAFMAPTQILAKQHYFTLKDFFKDTSLRIGFLSGNLTESERQVVLEEIKSGGIDIIVGTHALIQESVCFKNLGLIVTDEQHRFGVAQRAALYQKGSNPDVLVMSATPIPRSLALTLYGDLDISVIDEKPAGRKPVKTFLVDSKIRSRVYKFLMDNIKNGGQGYIVCPMIEVSASLNAKSVEQVYETLSKNPILQHKIGILHGELSPEQKESTMSAFLQKKISVLISTTVIEVGVNVPNATIMIVENAERFGLSQLHQLRGRVGRGKKQAYCILIMDTDKKETKERLKVLAESDDGFFIAEKDLEYRGPGDVIGTRQHGFSDFNQIDIFDDFKIIGDVHEEVKSIFLDKFKIKYFKKLIKTIQFETKDMSGRNAIFN